jgi:hypothetical protein
VHQTHVHRTQEHKSTPAGNESIRGRKALTMRGILSARVASSEDQEDKGKEFKEEQRTNKSMCIGQEKRWTK